SLHESPSIDLRLEGGDEPTFLRGGLPRSVLRDLRRGRWVVQEEVDLHGANREQAHHMLSAFLGDCLKRELRCVRVIHGKGLRSPGREPVLKRCVQVWLARHDGVLAYCQARPSEGGAGAMVVLLRASRRD
ncbi:MAG TPA: Smr/MutS family protein, partial [Acidiferrobacterales bacterium]|nr:Smr/MutS family protein [Acidiferrobacterales bacterium]